MNMLELQPDAEMKANKITYTYDQYDRVYLKNYYLGTVQRARYFVGRPNNLSATPKKLLYQDVYRYKSNNANQPHFVDRIYQPIVATPRLIRDAVFPNTAITATASVVCKSAIVQSGFVYALSTDALAIKTLYPGKSFWNNGYADAFIYSQLGSNGIGQLTWNFVEAATVYVKAYCTMETGVLFSKMASI